MTTTPWFEPHELPVRSGLYQVMGIHRIWWCWWDNEACQWGSVSETPFGAVGMRARPGAKQDRIWRGMLK